MPSAAAGAARSVAPDGPVVKPCVVGMPFEVVGVLVPLPEPVDIPLGVLPVMAIPLPLLGFMVGVLLPMPLPLVLVPVVLPLLVPLVALLPEFEVAPLPLAGVPEALPPPVADPLLPPLALVPPVGVVPPPVVPPPQSPPPPVVGALLHPARPVSTTAIANVDSAILPAGLSMGVRIMIRLR